LLLNLAPEPDNVAVTMAGENDLPDYVTAHFHLGFAYAAMGLRADAIAELEIGLQLDPDHDDAAKASALLAALNVDERSDPR
jgi:hypothetical protein